MPTLFSTGYSINIFITTERTTPENVFDVPQDKDSPRRHLRPSSNADLDFAIDNLAWTTPDFGRWTQASARHLRAKTRYVGRRIGTRPLLNPRR